MKIMIEIPAYDDWNRDRLVIFPGAVDDCIDIIDGMPTVDTIDHEQVVLKRYGVHEIKREDISNALSDFITLLINDLIEGKEDEID